MYDWVVQKQEPRSGTASSEEGTGGSEESHESEESEVDLEPECFVCGAKTTRGRWAEVDGRSPACNLCRASCASSLPFAHSSSVTSSIEDHLFASVDNALKTGSLEDARLALQARLWTDLEIDTLHELVQALPEQLENAIDVFRERVSLSCLFGPGRWRS